MAVFQNKLVLFIFLVIIGGFIAIFNSGNQIIAGHISARRISADNSKIHDDFLIDEIKEEKKEAVKPKMEDLLKTYRDFCSDSKLTKTLKNRASTLEGLSKGGVQFSTCVTAKSASTALTQMFLEITGFIKDPIDVKFNQIVNGDGRNNPSCDSFEKGCLLQPKEINKDSLKFIFVRDPMDRIFSGWKDKINSTVNREMYYEYPGKDIIRKEFNLGEDFELPKKKMEAHAMGFYVSFQMFARWLARDDNYKSNIHWNTVQSSCDICAFNFDFIGQISEMERDMRRLMKELNVESPTYDEIQKGFQSANAHSTKHSKLKIDEEFAKMTDIERAKLVNIYIDDYAAFGLPIPDFAK